MRRTDISAIDHCNGNVGQNKGAQIVVDRCFVNAKKDNVEEV